MGIFSRLGSVINSYVNDMAADSSRQFGSRSHSRSSGDPDLDAAFEELDDYLNRKDSKQKKDFDDLKRDSQKNASVQLPPEELRADFDYLGVAFGADEKTCKASYTKLLKIHHPDKHTGHEGNLKKATEKTKKINAAFERIEKWRERGNIS